MDDITDLFKSKKVNLVDDENAKNIEAERSRPLEYSDPVEDQYSFAGQTFRNSEGLFQTEDVSKIYDDLLNGKASVDNNVDYNMVDDQGVVRKVRGREALRAAARGWRFDSKEELTKRLLNRKMLGYEVGAEDSPFSSFTKNAANSLTFGIPEMVSDEFADELSVHGRVNPISSFAGSVAGDLAGIVGTGGISGLAAKGLAKGATSAAARGLTKLAEKGTLGKIAAKGAKNISDTALYDAVSFTTEASLGDPDQAAENLIMSLGVSGLLPIASTVGEGVLSKARKLVNVHKTHDYTPKRMFKEYEKDVQKQELWPNKLRDNDLLPPKTKTEKDILNYADNTLPAQAEQLRGAASNLLKSYEGRFSFNTDDILIHAKGNTKTKLESSLSDILGKSETVIDAGRLKTNPPKPRSLANLVDKRQELLGLGEKDQVAVIDRFLKRNVNADDMKAIAEKENFANELLDFADYYKQKEMKEFNASFFDKEHKTVAGIIGAKRALVDTGLVSIGSALGGNFAPLIVKIGYHGAKRFIKETGLFGKQLDNLLNKALKNKVIPEKERERYISSLFGGSSVIRDLHALNDDGLARKSSIINDFVGAGLTSTNTVKAGVHSYLGKNRKERREKAMQISQRFEELSQGEADGLLSVYFQGDAPTVNQSYVKKMKEIISFLKSKSANLQPTIDPIEGAIHASDADINKFERYLEAVYDPQGTVARMSKGVIKPEHVETISKLYPHLWAGIQYGALVNDDRKSERVKHVKAQVLGYNRPYSKNLRSFVTETMGWNAQQGEEQQQQQAPQKSNRDLKNLTGGLNSKVSSLSPQIRTSYREML